MEELDLKNLKIKFTLRLNIDSWGSYKKGDVDTFTIPLHDEQNGLTRFPIDKRWDVISLEPFTEKTDSNDIDAG